MHSLYSAFRNELAPSRIASYSSTSFEFCSLDSLVALLPETELTSSFTAATWLKRCRAKRTPTMPVTTMMSGAVEGPSTMPPFTQDCAAAIATDSLVSSVS